MALSDEPRLYENENGVGTDDPHEQRIRAVVKDGIIGLKPGTEVSIVPIGVPFHQAASEVTVAAGTEFNVLSSTVPASIERRMNKIIISSRAAGVFFIKVDNLLIGSGRLNSAKLNQVYLFDPYFPVGEGAVIDINFKMLHGKIGQPIEAYIMANDV